MEKTRALFGMALLAVLAFACPFTSPQETTENPPAMPLPQSPPVPAPNLSTNATSPSNLTANSSANSTATSQQIELQWSLITKANVEGVCLSEAKKQAVEKGYGEGVVFGCTCSAQESSESKSYACEVSALDGSHPVSVSCAKSAQSCQISSEAGAFAYSFEELQAMGNR
jgi:hypothetical protein